MAENEPKVKTFAQWKKDFEDAEIYSEEETKDLEMMLQTAETLDQLDVVCDNCDLENPMMLEILAKALEKMASIAVTKDDWEKIYWDSLGGSEMEDRAREEIAKFNQ